MYIPPPRKTRVDPITRKIINENKNILTNPPKFGTSAYPGIYFSYPEYKLPPKSAKTVRSHSKRGEKVFVDPFKPANTMLNGFFQNDKEQYGEPNHLIKLKTEYFKNYKKVKYSKSKKTNWANHEAPFRPNSFTKIGEEGYFSQRYGVPFVPFIATKKKVQGTYKDTFKYIFLL